MVYFAYNHIAFVTLLALAAMNAVQPLNYQLLIMFISAVDENIRGFKPIVDGAEQAVQNLTDKILIQNASLRGEIETYVNCLKTANKYIWGEIALNKLADRVSREKNLRAQEILKCCRQEALEYSNKKMAFPLDKCFENLPPAPHEDLNQLNLLTRTLYDHKHWVAMQVFYKKILETNL
uniref:Uncharacterized protein n=1 Tax=Trichobilharzia regenti TaxID=157069 RepID=A0AA85JMQ6_TRIRE|nr:unnamed protein product [Trichobilharzia regenti]